MRESMQTFLMEKWTLKLKLAISEVFLFVFLVKIQIVLKVHEQVWFVMENVVHKSVTDWLKGFPQKFWQAWQSLCSTSCLVAARQLTDTSIQKSFVFYCISNSCYNFLKSGNIVCVLCEVWWIERVSTRCLARFSGHHVIHGSISAQECAPCVCMSVPQEVTPLVQGEHFCALVCWECSWHVKECWESVLYCEYHSRILSLCSGFTQQFLSVFGASWHSQKVEASAVCSDCVFLHWWHKLSGTGRNCWVSLEKVSLWQMGFFSICVDFFFFFFCCDVWQGYVVIYTTRHFRLWFGKPCTETVGDEVCPVGYQNRIVGQWKWNSDNGISCQRFLVTERILLCWSKRDGRWFVLSVESGFFVSSLHKVYNFECWSGKWIKPKLTFTGKGLGFFMIICDLHLLSTGYHYHWDRSWYICNNLGKKVQQRKNVWLSNVSEQKLSWSECWWTVYCECI